MALVLGLGLGLLERAIQPPSLSLDFLSTTTLDSRITFTRGSNATRVNSSGVIVTASNDVPRFDYDPVTLAAKGLLIEESRTNLLTYSDQFDNAAWTATGATITANSTAAPSGVVAADTLVEDTSTGVHRVFATPACSPSTIYTYTNFIKAAGRTEVRLLETTLGGAFFNLANGTVGTVDAGVTASITPVGNGWFRCRITATTGVAQTLFVSQIQSVAAGSNNYTGTGSASLYLWGAQLEAGAFATSYIPTVASTVTRSADVATMTGTNFSSWYNQSAGTFVVGADTVATVAGKFPSTFSANDGTVSNRVGQYVAASGGTMRTQSTIAGVANSAATANTVTSGTAFKAAGAYESGTIVVVLNGGTVATNTNSGLATVNRLSLGIFDDYLNGHIQTIAYFNTRLANAQLQSLTA